MASDGEKGEYHLLSDTGTDEKSRGERFWESLTGSKPNKSKKSSHTKPLLSLGDSAEQSAADDDDAGAQDEEQVNPPLGRQRSASEASDYIQRYDVEAGDESNYQPGRRTYHRTDWSQRPERVPDEYMHEDSGAVSDTGQRGASSSRSYHRMQERNLTSANHREQTTEEAWSSQFQGTQSQPAYVVPAKQIVRAPVHRGPPLYGVARRTANPLRKPSNIRPAFGRHHKASTGSVTGSYRDPLFNDLTGGGDINYQSAARDNPMRMGRKDKKEDRARVIEERRRRRKEQRKIERLTGTGSDHDSQSLTTEVEEDKKAKSSSKSGKWKKKNRKSSTSGSNKSSTSSSESDSDSSSENETARLSAYCTCGVLSTPELRKELRSSGSHDLLPHSIKNGPPLKWYHTVYTDVLHSKGIPYHQGRHGSQIQAGVHDFSQTLGSRETDKALEKDVEEKKRQVGLDPDDTIQEARDSEENFEQRFHKRGVIPEFKDEEESENSELPWQQIKDTQQPFPESQRNQSNHGIELATDRSLANGVEQTKTSKAVKFNERGEEEIIGKPVEEERFSSPDIFYFTFGVVVFWGKHNWPQAYIIRSFLIFSPFFQPGFTESQEREFLERIRKFQYQLVKTIEYDDMAYAYVD